MKRNHLFQYLNLRTTTKCRLAQLFPYHRKKIKDTKVSIQCKVIYVHLRNMRNTQILYLQQYLNMLMM